MILRSATADDADRIAEIYNESIAAGNTTMDEKRWSAKRVERMLLTLRRNEGILVLIDDDAFVIGWGVLKRYSDRSGYRHTGETAVYLTRSRLRSGGGSTIKRGLIQLAEGHGYHHLVAKVLSENTGSVEFNLRFGYVVVGTQKEIGLLGGRWRDVTILQLLLPGGR
jgi:L-amino acid N-acyltransferase YncA